MTKVLAKGERNPAELSTLFGNGAGAITEIAALGGTGDGARPYTRNHHGAGLCGNRFSGWHHAQLLQQAQGVPTTPALDEFSVSRLAE
jgi:hypothetical protein